MYTTYYKATLLHKVLHSLLFNIYNDLFASTYTLCVKSILSAVAYTKC